MSYLGGLLSSGSMWQGLGRQLGRPAAAAALDWSHPLSLADPRFGGVGDAVTSSGWSGSGGTISKTSHGIGAKSVGKKVLIPGGGAAGDDLVATIVSYDADNVGVSPSLSTAISNATIVYGTDNGAAIAAWLAAIGSRGGMGFIPKPSADGYLFTDHDGDGSCVLITTNVRIEGTGHFCALIPACNKATNVLTIKPSTAVALDRLRLAGFSLGNPLNAYRAGLVGISVDTQVAGSYLPLPVFEGLAVWQGAGHAFSHVNSVGNNANGGMYGAVIRDGQFQGRLSFSGSGDSIALRDNIIAGTGLGILVNLITGASCFIIDHNNITAQQGAIKVSAGNRVQIVNGNNIEQKVAIAGNNNNAIIDLEGDAATLTSCLIQGNHLGAFSGTGVTANIRVRNALHTFINMNTLLPASGSTKWCDIAASAGTVLGTNQIGTGGGGLADDGASGTVVVGIAAGTPHTSAATG